MILFFGILAVLAVVMWYRFSLVVSWFPLLFLSYLWSVTVVGVPVTFLEAATWLLGLMWCVWYLRTPRSERVSLDLFHSVANPWWRRYWPGIMLLILGVGLSFLVIPSEVLFHRGLPEGPEYETFETLRIALGIVKGWIIAPLIYLFVLVHTVRTRTQMDTVLSAYVFSTVLLALYSLTAFLPGEFIDRLQGPFLSPNYLAMYIAPGFLLALIQTTRQWKQSKRWKALGSWMGVLLLGIVLVFTKTYASWIGVMVALMFAVYFLCSPRGRKWAYMGLLLLFVAGVMVLAPTEKFQRFFDATGDSSTAVRLEVYEIARGLLERSPWLGIGPGQFEAQYKVQGPEILGHLPKEWVMLHPHNTALSFWLYSGVLGLLGWVWLTVAFFVRSGRNILYFWPLMTVMLLFLVHGLFDMYFWKNDLVYLFWMILGLATITPKFHFLGMKKR